MNIRWLIVALLGGCSTTIINGATVCFDMPTALPDEVAVEALQTGGEQGPEDGQCTLTDADGWRVTVSFRIPADPSPWAQNAIARLSRTTCSAVVDSDDPWEVAYGDLTLSVPVDGQRHCFDPSGAIVEGF